MTTHVPTSSPDSTLKLTIEEFSTNDILVLMNTYLSEWMHRDELLWKQVFKYFYATLIVIFLPNIASYLKIALPLFPPIIFPIVGVSLSLVFLYVSIGYAKRLEASGNTYQKFIDMFPEDFKRQALADPEIRCGKFFSKRMSVVICTLMFVGLLVLSSTMIIYYLIP